MNRFLRWLGLALIVISSFGSVSGQKSEEQHIERLLLWQTSTQSEIRSLNADGSTTLIAALDDISFNGILSEWNVLVAVDVAPSSDGQHIAFTATTYYGDPAMLFIVSLNPLRVRQFETPDIARVEWSPTGDALLLDRPSQYIGSRIGESGKVYVFDLATETHTLVAESNESWEVDHATWSPTGDHIIVTVDPYVNPDELHIEELYLVTRDGSDWQPLTNLAVEAPQLIDFGQPYDRNFCDIGKIKWSVRDTRIYYTLECGEYPITSLFSVDMEGNNRLELDLLEYFPIDFQPQLGTSARKLVELLVGTDAVYLVVDLPKFKLHIIRVSTPGQAEVIYSATARSESIFAVMSDDKTKIAFSERPGIVGSLDLTTNTQDMLDLTDRELSVCRVQWLDNHTVLIDEVDLCGRLNPQFFQVENTLAWTPETGTLESVAENLAGGIKLIIPLPEVPEVPSGFNLPPIASAGSDLTVVDIDDDGVEIVTLDGTGSSDTEAAIAQFEWYENGVLLATGMQPDVTLTTGLHVLTLRVVDVDGAADLDFVAVNIEPA